MEIDKYINEYGSAAWADTDVVIISRGADFRHRAGGKGNYVSNDDRDVMREQDNTFQQICTLLRQPIETRCQVLWLGFGTKDTWQLDGRLADHFTTRANDWHRRLRAHAIPVITMGNAYAQLQNPKHVAPCKKKPGDDHLFGRKADNWFPALISHMMTVHNHCHQIRELSNLYEKVWYRARQMR